MTIKHYRNILVAVDESENAHRAVDYVASFLKGLDGFHITLLHVFQESDEDYFPNEAERQDAMQTEEERIDRMMIDLRQMLLNAGFAAQAITVRTTRRHCPSMADCILAEQDRLQAGTLVVGRKGMSRKEEILFGSVSSRLIRTARDCTVWVVE